MKNGREKHLILSPDDVNLSKVLQIFPKREQNGTEDHLINNDKDVPVPELDEGFEQDTYNLEEVENPETKALISIEENSARFDGASNHNNIISQSVQYLDPCVGVDAEGGHNVGPEDVDYGGSYTGSGQELTEDKFRTMAHVPKVEENLPVCEEGTCNNSSATPDADNEATSSSTDNNRRLDNSKIKRIVKRLFRARSEGTTRLYRNDLRVLRVRDGKILERPCTMTIRRHRSQSVDSGIKDIYAAVPCSDLPHRPMKNKAEKKETTSHRIPPIIIKTTHHHEAIVCNKKEATASVGTANPIKNRHRSSHSSSHHSSHHRKDNKDRDRYRCSHCQRRKTKNVSVGIQARKEHDISNSKLKRLAPSVKLLPSGNFVHPANSHFRYRKYLHIEEHPNGGASVVHMYQKEIEHLSKEQLKDLAHEFFKETFSEDENHHAHHVMGIVHGAATYLPDLLEYMAMHHPTLVVKNGVLGRNSDIETSSFIQYHEQVSFYLKF